MIRKKGTAADLFRMFGGSKNARVREHTTGVDSEEDGA